MAYGNWGAFAFKNGERQRSREDNSPYEEEQHTPGYHQAFTIDCGRLGPHHAVLGDGDIRLCGYKCYPVLYLRGDKVDLEPYATERDHDGDGVAYQGELEGSKFTATLTENRVELWLRMPDGTVWTGTSGYMMGAGFEDES